MMYLILVVVMLSQWYHKEKKPLQTPDIYCEKGWLKHSQPGSNADTVVYFGQKCLGQGRHIHVNKYDYKNPCFNPNNPNQIAYVRHLNRSLSSGVGEIWTFDLCTGKQKMLTKTHINGLSWSKKNWLLFSAGRTLYKIKPDGDSLTQLTFDNRGSRAASWNDSGDQFIYQKNSSCIIANEHGVSLDTIHALSNYSTLKWAKNSSLVLPMNTHERKSGVGMYDLLQQSNVQIDTLGDINIMKDFDFSKDNIVWLIIGLGNNKRWEINKTNIHTRERKLISKGFVNRQYQSIDVSLDGSKLLVHRRDLSQISICRIAEKNYIYIMNIDGTEERRINIPE